MIYPKLLIVSSINPLVDSDSCSVTIRSFLGKWPKDRVAVVVCGDFNLQRGLSYENVFNLNIRDVLFAGKIFGVQRDASTIMPSPVSNTTNSKFNIKRSLRDLFKGLISECPYCLNKDTLEFVREFNPDVIYSSTSGNRTTKLTIDLAKYFNVPYILHFLDDWPDVYLENTRLTFLLRNIFKRKLFKAINNSSFCFCISEAMCELYKIRYKNERFKMLLNSVDSYSGKTINVSQEDCITFLYIGSLYLGRDEALFQFCNSLNRYSGLRKFKLQICAPQKQWDSVSSKFRTFDFVSYEGYLSPNEISIKISESTILLFVESFNEAIIKYTKVSLSTRIPEYLASGKPIIAIGPSQQESIRYLMLNNAAFIIDEKQKFQKVIHDCLMGSHVNLILANAKILFEKNHQSKNQQELFYNSVVNCCQKCK